MPPVDVLRTYLQLTDPSQLRAAGRDPRLRVERVESCPPSFYRYLYVEVGKKWHWRDRIEWTDERIARHLADPAVSLWVGCVSGAPAGWFELVRHGDGSVEIAYFGLLPERTGRGLGRRLLTDAVERAWSLGATRVWLHTCSLDSPAALPNYLARGFVSFKEERYTTTIADGA
ncbi:MAG TPA: GNAT family N-acetyltransferase [Gemmatimonadaceae bacterium]